MLRIVHQRLILGPAEDLTVTWLNACLIAKKHCVYIQKLSEIIIINIIGVKKTSQRPGILCVSIAHKQAWKNGPKTGSASRNQFFFYNFFKTLEPVYLTSFNLFKPEFYFLF